MSKDLARQALVEAVGSASIGEYLEAQAEEAAELTSHIFASKQKGYVGWRWSVTVFQADKKAEATVSEIVLLPGPDSVVAPDWVPWSERLADYKALQAELEAQAALDAEEESEDEVEEEAEEEELATSDVEESVDAEQDSEATSRKPRFLRRRKRLGKDKAKDKGKKPKA
jgi:Protein of unknown function (DUF3027)